jgi:signal transduction histidine kinase
MRNRLLISYGALVLAVLVILGVPLGVSFARSERRQLQDAVRHDALALALRSAAELEAKTYAPVRALASEYAGRTGARVVVTDSAGISVADSDPRAELGRDFSTRPEIATALRGEETVGTRRSDTLDTDLLFVAEPVATAGRIHGAVRITYPTSVVQSRITRAWLLLLATGVVVLALAMLLAVFLARTLAAPLRGLTSRAAELGAGDLTSRADTEQGPEEVRLLAAVFNDTAERLQALLVRQQDFVAHASHQLRSPLAALRLRLENLEDDLSGNQAADVAAALREVQRLSRLVDGLLALARLDSAEATPTPVSLPALLAERGQVWEPYASERGVAVVVEASGELTVLASPGHLEQVLDNLIANALEVAPHGSTLTLRAVEVGEYGELHVIDEGPGMSAEDREHAFERFWRSRESRPAGGSGLGLAIVQRLVHADGGEVALRPVVAGGIDAVVRLPRTADASRARRVDVPASSSRP